MIPAGLNWLECALAKGSHKLCDLAFVQNELPGALQIQNLLHICGLHAKHNAIINA